MLRPFACLVLVGAAASGADWSWPLPSEVAAATPRIDICPFLYGKQWAYAIEIDDGPKWAGSFAVPFLAEYHFSDAPPGLQGGRQLPFVGGIAVIVSPVGANSAIVDWDDLKAMRAAGWGVLNHSLNHIGRSWGDDAGRLTTAQITEDGFWSQALLAYGMGTGRAPTGYVYANGYLDYNRGGILESLGLRIATRAGAPNPADVTHGDIAWLDFGRNYLDEGTWANEQKGDPMSGFPVLDGDGPLKRLIIDFTHVIEQAASSANNQRWRKRLSTISDQWGAKGRDNLWCAPTSEIADYLRAMRVAKALLGRDQLTISIPYGIPGSRLTARLTGIPASARLTAPPGTVLYRRGDTAWITTPMIGMEGSPAPLPHIRCAYAGPPGTIDLGSHCVVAGVSVHIARDLPDKFSYEVKLRTATGERLLVEKTMKAGWFVGSNLHAIVPNAEPIAATGLTLAPQPGIDKIEVWVVDAGTAKPAGH